MIADRLRADGRPAGDPVFFTVLACLAVLGLLTVYTSSAAVSLDRFGTPHGYFLRHVAHLAVGTVACVVLWRIDYRLLDRTQVVHGAWAVMLVLLGLTLVQSPIGGARRWLRLGELSIQPSEIAKLVVVLLAAFQLSRRLDRLSDPWKGLLPPLLLTAQIAVLVALQPDFGTATVLIGLLGLAAVVAGTPWRVLAGFGTAIAATLAVYLIQEPYRLTRLRAFANPDVDLLGANFQLRQSLIAIGTGGFTGCSSDGLMGTGLGCSVQKLFFLPEPHTDFVFAVLGEELGLVGTGVVLALFTVLLVRGFIIAGRAQDVFGMLLASGATAIIGSQALVNMAVVVGLVPTKGLPLPFLSAGGSSLLTCMAAAGLVLSVSRHGG